MMDAAQVPHSRDTSTLLVPASRPPPCARTNLARSAHALKLLVLVAMMNTGCATGGGSLSQMDAARPLDAAADSGAEPRDAGTDAATAPTDAPPGDAGVPTVDAGIDAGIDAGTDAGSTCAPTPDTIAIVEVMPSSRSGAGDRGEWFEIVNVGSCAVDLTGLQVISPDALGMALTFTIPGGLMPPGDRFVLAQSASAAENHDLPFDITWDGSGIVLDNGSDSIELRSGATTIDRISWISGDYVHGTARAFPDTLSISLNDSQARWCNATAVYSTAAGGPYRGTPGMPNGACP